MLRSTIDVYKRQGYDRQKGTVDIIFQVVGATTMCLSHKEAGDSIQDFVGPLGVPTRTEGLKKVAVVGGGVGCAIAYPVAKELSLIHIWCTTMPPPVPLFFRSKSHSGAAIGSRAARSHFRYRSF